VDLVSQHKALGITAPPVSLPRHVKVDWQSPRSDIFVKFIFYAKNHDLFDLVELDYLPSGLFGTKSADDDCSILLLLLHC
jgi:hypothetical protein